MSTAVRDVSQAFLNQPASSIGRNTAAGGDFHKVITFLQRNSTGSGLRDQAEELQGPAQGARAALTLMVCGDLNRYGSHRLRCLNVWP